MSNLKHQKRMAFLASLLMLLLCALMTQAAEGDLDLSLQDRNATGMAVIGDTVFLHNSRSGSLHHLVPGQTESSLLFTLPALPDINEYPLVMADLKEEDRALAQNAVMDIVSDGKRLIALNYYAGRIGTITKEGALTWQEKPFDTSGLFEGERLRLQLGEPFYQDGCVYVPYNTMDMDAEFDQQALVKIDLDTLKSQTLRPENVQAFAPYQQGSLLAQQAVKKDMGTVWQLGVLDLNTLKISPLPLPMPEAEPYVNSPAGIAYDRENDAVYYAFANRLMRSQGMEGFVLKAVLPFHFTGVDQTHALLLKDGRYAVSGYSMATGDQVLALRDAKGGLSNLLVAQQNISYSDALDAYMKEHHPDITLVQDMASTTPGKVANRIRSGDKDTDLFTLPVTSNLRALVEKGYAGSLDASEVLVREARSFYPAIQEVIFDKQGHLVAWPVSLTVNLPMINESVWRDYFGEEPQVETYLDMAKGYLRYTQMLEEKEPQFHFIYLDTPPESIVENIIKAYIRQYEQPDESLRFDRPALKQVLEVLAQVREEQAKPGYQELIARIPEEEAVNEFFNFHGRILRFTGSDATYGQKRGLVFEKGEIPAVMGQMMVMTINPLSEHRENALTYLESMAKKENNPTLYYALRPQENEPMENPNFEQIKQKSLEDQALLQEALNKAQLEKAPQEDIDLIKLRLTWAKNEISEDGSGRWLVAPKPLSDYREIAPQVRYSFHSNYLTGYEGSPAWEQFQSLCLRHAQGQLSVDAFVNELDNLSSLVFNEGR